MYSFSRLNDIYQAVQATKAQSVNPLEVIIVVDYNDNLYESLQSLPDVCLVRNSKTKGLSGARNTGVSVAQGEIIVFLDDDARPLPNWLENLLAPYVSSNVIGVGGAAMPAWDHDGVAPTWFPEEFYWVVGCSYEGLPSSCAAVRNPIGANMSFRRAAFDIAGLFSEGVGRDDSRSLPLGCEETEFGIRVRRAAMDLEIMYEPNAIVLHRVTEARMSKRYFVSRCFAEGLSKARVARTVGPAHALSSERRYVAYALRRAVCREVRGFITGDITAGARLLMMFAGTASALVGLTRGYVESNLCTWTMAMSGTAKSGQGV